MCGWEGGGGRIKSTFRPKTLGFSNVSSDSNNRRTEETKKKRDKQL